MTTGVARATWLDDLVSRLRARAVDVRQAVASDGALELTLPTPDGAPLSVEVVPKVGDRRAYKATARFLVSYRGARDLGPALRGAIDAIVAEVTALERDPGFGLRDFALVGEPGDDGGRLFSRVFPFAQLERSGAAADSNVEILVRLTEACNQHCSFCSAPPSRTPSPEAVRACIDWVDERLPEARLTLTGGEPTLRATFAEEVRYALSKTRVRDVLVQTNAVSFARSDRLEALPRDARLSFFVSLHAVDAGLYDRITGTDGQLPLALAGLRRLLEAGHPVVLNAVVMADNLAHLPELLAALPSLLAPHPVPTLHFSILMCPPERPDAADHLVPYTELAPALAAAAAAAEALGLHVEPLVSSTHASLPLCVVSAADRAAALHRPLILPDETGYEDFDRSWVKANRCRDCAATEQCLGVPVPYARRFGLGELRPLLPT